MDKAKKPYKNFWKKTNEDDFLICEPYSEEKLKSIESKLGYKIPESYKTLMLTNNGGMLKRQFFPLKNDQGKITKIFRCEYLFGIADNDRNCLLGEYNNIRRENGKTIGHYDFIMDGFQIGEWQPDSGWGSTYVYLDFSLCGKDNEPRVCAYEMKWSPKHKQALSIDYVIAENFTEFVENLITKPILEPFDFDAFEVKVIGGVKETLNKLLEEYSCDEISAFGLYTDDGSFVSTSINTVQSKDCDDQYVTSEWTLEGTNDADVFSELTSRLEDHVALLQTEGKIKIFRNKLIDCCTNALLKLKKDGFFLERLGKDIILMVGTSHGDMAQAKFEQIKEMLNPK